MEDQIITSETVKLAEKKGFNLSYRGSYPTQSLLQKWLRETHNIHIICFYRPSTKLWSINCTHINIGEEQYTLEFKESQHANVDLLYNTYEEALEVGLQTALNLIP